MLAGPQFSFLREKDAAGFLGRGEKALQRATKGNGWKVNLFYTRQMV
jgi:hypothetical protein